MKTRVVLLAGILGLISLNAAGNDWPQWRGPMRDGISRETGLAKQWPDDGPKLIWQNKEVAEGWGSPSIVGDTLYLLGNRGKEEETVSAYKTSDGSRVWSTKIGAVGKLNMQPSYPGARSTPTVDHGMIFVLGSDGDLAALDSKGSIKWHKNVRTDFGGESGIWAYAESPLVDGDAVVVAPGNATATVVALNKNTGAEIWRCAIPEGDQAAYASAIVVNQGGVKQYVQVLQKAMVGVDAKTGKLLWRYERAAKGSPANIPTPVERNGIIYTAGARTGAGAVRLKADGGKVTVEEVYFDTKLPAAIGGAVLVGDTLYGTSGQGAQGSLQAIDFQSGKVKWQDKSIGAGSLVFADGHLILHGEEGQVAMIEASPAAYKEQGRLAPKDAPPKGNSKTWAYPALADGQLYLHEGSSLWRYDLK